VEGNEVEASDEVYVVVPIPIARHVVEEPMDVGSDFVSETRKADNPVSCLLINGETLCDCCEGRSNLRSVRTSPHEPNIFSIIIDRTI